MAKEKVQKNKPGTYVVHEDGSIVMVSESTTLPGDEGQSERVKEWGEEVKTYSLHRMGPDKKWKFLGRFEAQPGMDEFVRQTFGGGEYKALGFKDNKEFAKGETIYLSVDPAYPQKKFDVPTEQSTSTVTAQTSSRLEKLMESFIQIQLMKMQEGAQGKADPIEMAVRIAEIIKGSVPQTTPITEAIGLLTKGIELGKDMVADGDSFWPVVKEMGIPVVQLLTKAVEKTGPGVLNGSPQRVLEKAKTSTEQTVNPSTPQPERQAMDLNTVIKQFAPQLLALARSGKRAEVYAEVFLDQVPESYFDTIYLEFSQPTFFDKVVTLFPGVKEQEAWFKEFITCVAESLAPEPETPQATVGDNGYTEDEGGE